MSWNDIMRRVLPPVWDQRRKTYVHPHVTSPYGETYTRPKGSSNPHGGIDFNYLGGQTSLNLSHQGLRSPVTGVVTNAGEGNVGRIAIRDANGFTHEILHTHAQHVSIGDPVVAGQLIGTMGNTGVKPKLSHYQLKDRDGKVVDPTTYWDQQGPIDPDPAPPAYLDDYQRYLATPGAAMGNADINALNDGVIEKSSLHQFQSPPTKSRGALSRPDECGAAAFREGACRRPRCAITEKNERRTRHGRSMDRCQPAALVRRSLWNWKLAPFCAGRQSRFANLSDTTKLSEIGNSRCAAIDTRAI